MSERNKNKYIIIKQKYLDFYLKHEACILEDNRFAKEFRIIGRLLSI